MSYFGNKALADIEIKSSAPLDYHKKITALDVDRTARLKSLVMQNQEIHRGSSVKECLN